MSDGNLQRQMEEEIARIKSLISDLPQSNLPLIEMLLKDLQRRIEAERRLLEVNRWMELAQDFGGVASYHYDVTSGQLHWSSSVCRIYGFPEDVAPSLDLWLSRIHPDDRDRVMGNAQAAIAEGRHVDQYFRVRLGDGERWIHDRGQVEVDLSGRPARIYGVNVDVTEAKLEQVALGESERRFRRTFEHANVGVAHVSLHGRFIRANERLCRLLGRTEAELTRITFQDITYPDDLAADMTQLEALIAGEIDDYTMEKRYIRPDGSLVWADLSVSLLRGPDGEPVKFIAVISDIQERKRAEERIELVLAEAAHRTKNLMAVISAVVSSSARTVDTSRELEEVVSARLRSMGASHDLLVGKYVNGTTLDRLIRRQLEIFAVHGSDRIEVTGPGLNIAPRAVHAFGMVIHELATNACKYGALSGDTGVVVVAWTVDEAERTLRFVWTEQDGPPVPKVYRAGFGTRVLERMLTGALGGAAHLSIEDTGARFVASVPLASLVD